MHRCRHPACYRRAHETHKCGMQRSPLAHSAPCYQTRWSLLAWCHFRPQLPCLTWCLSFYIQFVIEWHLFKIWNVTSCVPCTLHVLSQSIPSQSSQCYTAPLPSSAKHALRGKLNSTFHCPFVLSNSYTIHHSRGATGIKYDNTSTNHIRCHM